MDKEKLYLEIIDTIDDGIYFVEKDRKITFWNKSAERITGYKKEDILGKYCQNNILKHIDESGRPLCTTGCPLLATVEDGGFREHKVFMKHKDGYRTPIKVRIFPITDNGEIIGAAEVFSPSSPDAYEEDFIEGIINSAMNDQLTGIPNRRKIESFLEYKFSEMKRFHNKFCMIFLDIDNFGSFNNTYGHDLGDDVLKGVTKSVIKATRDSDLFGRWGGEEFLGIYRIINDSDVAVLAEKIRALIANTEIKYGDSELSVTVSIGATIANEEDTIDTLVKRADSLMYISKQNGKNRVTTDYE